MGQILVVEDNPLVAKFYRLALTRLGRLEVVCLEDPQEILARSRAGGVDLVILDVSLSNSRYGGKPVDGIELAQLLKQDSQTRHIPILLATAHAMEGDRERLLEASGADGYIEKPIHDLNVLIDKVNALLRR